jgi:hypothetical protein
MPHSHPGLLPQEEAVRTGARYRLFFNPTPLPTEGHLRPLRQDAARASPAEEDTISPNQPNGRGLRGDFNTPAPYPL